MIGHAFEARIYAENVARGFLPATGTLHHYQPVSISPTVRVETGVQEGDTVSMHYDPMIAKLVVWGENRKAALVKLKNCLQNFQVAGLPTNITFLQRLANHWAFEKGLVGTNFIEHFRNDLFIDLNDEAASETYAAARFSASLVAACICEKDHITSKEALLGRDKLHSLWYTHPPFRMHHSAQRKMELEWDAELNGSCQELMKLAITYLPKGSYIIEFEDGGSPGLEVKVTHLGNHNFRVDADGLNTYITLALYSKDNNKHIDIWHGKHHHHYRQSKKVIERSDCATSDKPSSETVSLPKGSVMAPMAGLVVKVLLENGAQVEEGQSILVLEAMKMEHVIKSPRAGYVDGLQVAPGQQVFDTSVLFTIKDK
ncbi:methylcrotonoyl-CoA carboxylase subunit alpha, mitochondrial isoform X2 [Iris pallida]|uniref:Methylcrotonoyl-CoA carboxylase subunit alpha, mitochondrial isoform X2 n=1 Tax=Iris pallida TaxID=29817 RepID=A0AAX6DU74_IRIPA|nr:methylcrotonoyl-CoA carboxylase subunit alpha, mitochondrial isoform X2 [Iris pallida]